MGIMRNVSILGLLAGVATLAGCGGGSTSSVATNGTGRAAVLLTDSPREDYAHIWATIYHVELVPSSGSNVVLYDSAAGTQIDMKTLRDATGQRFSFLGSAAIPNGTYTGVRITIGSTMQLFQNGTAVGNPLPVDSSVPVDSSGKPIITVTFRSAKTLGTGTTNLIVDVDLAHFVIKNSKVIPAIVKGLETGINDATRHNDGDYQGTVRALSGTAPVLTFTLTKGDSTTVTVVTTASSAIYGYGTLANASIVEVNGTLDPTTQNLVATQIEICPSGSGGVPSDISSPRAAGTASSLDATAGSFTLTISRSHGFTPSQTTLNVITSRSTNFVADGGLTITQAAYFAALAATPDTAVVGSYDSGTNTLTATTVKITNHALDGGWEHGQHGFREGIDEHNWGHPHH